MCDLFSDTHLPTNKCDHPRHFLLPHTLRRCVSMCVCRLPSPRISMETSSFHIKTIITHTHTHTSDCHRQIKRTQKESNFLVLSTINSISLPPLPPIFTSTCPFFMSNICKFGGLRFRQLPRACLPPRNILILVGRTWPLSLPPPRQMAQFGGFV